MFKFLGRIKRCTEITNAIKGRLIGSFPPATLIAEKIQHYTLFGGNLKEILVELNDNCILSLQQKKQVRKDDWSW